MKANEVRLAEMNEIAMQLVSLGQTEAALKIRTQMDDLNTKWTSLQQLTAERASQLGSAHEVQRFVYFKSIILMVYVYSQFYSVDSIVMSTKLRTGFKKRTRLLTMTTLEKICVVFKLCKENMKDWKEIWPL